MKKLRDFWPFLVIFVVWLVLFWPFFSKKLLPIPADIIAGVYYPWLDYKWGYSVGVPVKNPLLSDIPSILYPWRSFVIDELKSGRWPLWNPYYFGGMPLLANFQSAVFSYANIFILFFSKPIAWSLGVMASPLLTLLAMYGFLRHKKLGQLPALLGSIVFSLSGFEIAWMQYNVHGHTALFLPLLLWVIDLIFEDKKKFLFLVPVLIACQIFTGYIPVVIYTCLASFLYVGFFYLLPEIRKGSLELKKYAFLALFWFWGILLAGIQLLPGWELTKNSIRATDPTVEASSASHLPLANLVTLIAPDFFGNPATGNYFGKAFYDNFYFFVGTGTLIFVFYSLLLFKKDKNVQFWFLMLVVSFILVFKNPLGLFLEKLLFLSGGVASKALFITDFSLALLASFGFNFFLKENSKKRKKVFIPIFLMVILSLFAVLSAIKLRQNFQLIAIRNLVIPYLTLFLCSIVLVAMIKFSKNFFLPILFLFFVSFQLLYSARKYLPFSKGELLFPKTPVIDFLLDERNKSEEPFRVEIGNVIPQNFLMPYGIETTSGYDALLPRQTGEFLSLVETGKVAERISRVQLIGNYDSPFFPLTNTRYILAKKITKEGIFSPDGKPPDQFLNSRYKMVFEDKTVQVYEDGRYLPRAVFISGESFSGDLYGLVSAAQKKPGSAKIGWLDYEVDRKTLEVKTEKDGFLILTDCNFSGWDAFINGKKISLEENFPFLTVKIPRGENTVRFEYNPRSFYWGARITFISLIILIFIGTAFLLKNEERYGDIAI